MNPFVEEETKKESPVEARIKILGTGCSKCQKLEENVIAAVEEAKLDLAIKYVEDMAEIASYGVMSTPALLLDDKVLSYGKVLSKEDIIKILKENL
ncbi:thioredoxin family protein [Brachyspira hampsonii]|uniref:Thioredoxin family protein n=1 Tax=Brachyspira hampsonii TaxID=1287055 RepID=A0AAC9XK84_9SPIR|nr:thioredoxin family protein [Brachyspira hampsonii]MBW5380212.1 thioredoxin family protein [Brachyspira hampsonii]MBW5408773.1 thioredoxin family protein [Brachyspira hampsonii]